MMNAVKKIEVVREVEVSVVKAPAKKKKARLRPWVKVVLALGITSSFAGIMDVCTTSTEELASKVTWVDAYAHEGDGYERMVRSANANKDLDIKDMSFIMQDKNNHVDVIAGEVYQVPVLEAK